MLNIVKLTSALFILNSSVAMAGDQTFPSPISNPSGLDSPTVGPNEGLRKTNGGFLLPYFGTEPKAIFFNSGANPVHLNAMFGVLPSIKETHGGTSITDDRYSWFVLVTDFPDPGRLNPNELNKTLPALVKKSLEGSSDDGPFYPKVSKKVPSIYGLWEIDWITIRLSIPKGFGAWVTPYALKKNDTIKSCPGFEIGKGWACTDDKYHFRYWILSVESR